MTLPPEINEDDIINVEVIEPRSSKSGISIARRLAVQVLYEVDSTQHTMDVVLNERLQEEQVVHNIAHYLQVLVVGVLEYRDRLDLLIQRYAAEWPLDQVAIVDRNILRIAAYEMVFEDQVPVGVTIDEALMLSDLFGGEATPRFVNGVLGALARGLDEITVELRPPDGADGDSD